jgi:hypothetical protein
MRLDMLELWRGGAQAGEALMGLLTGLLAIAAIMVVLSTLTTAIMEIIHAALKKRVKALEQ